MKVVVVTVVKVAVNQVALKKIEKKRNEMKNPRKNTSQVDMMMKSRELRVKLGIKKKTINIDHTHQKSIQKVGKGSPVNQVKNSIEEKMINGGGDECLIAFLSYYRVNS